MKTTFNFLKLSTLAFVLTFASTSCSLFEKNDDPKPKPDANQVEYNGSKYTLEKSLMIDYGPLSLYGDDDTHFNHDFYIADGNIAYNDGEVTEIQGAFAVFSELVSAGATKFNTGTFNYIDYNNDGSLNESQLEAKYKNKSVFADAQVYIDTNGNRILSDETPIKATGGSIKLSGSGNTYTLEYNLVLENGKTLKGSNSSSFSKIDG
jgi:hypothetical protein